MNDYSKYIEDENIRDMKIDNDFTSSDGIMNRNNAYDNLYHKSYEISNNNYWCNINGNCTIEEIKEK